MASEATAVTQPSLSQLQALGLRPGELVRVRSVLEIGPTLDARVSLDDVPFMPEMPLRFRELDRYVTDVGNWGLVVRPASNAAHATSTFPV
jgi:hypothetical protein